MSQQIISQSEKDQKLKRVQKNRDNLEGNIPKQTLDREEDGEEEFQDIKNVKENQEFNNYHDLLVRQRKHEEQLYLKQLEFELQANRKMGEINELIVKKYDLVGTQLKMEMDIQRENERDTAVFEKNLNPKQNPELRRTPLYDENTPEEYVSKKRNIYNKLKDQDIREIFLKMKQDAHKYDSVKYSSDINQLRRLNEQHTYTAMDYYSAQPYVEMDRQKILYMIGESNYMLSCLQNLQDKHQLSLASTQPKLHMSTKSLQHVGTHQKNKTSLSSQYSEQKQREAEIAEEKQKKKQEIQEQLSERLLMRQELKNSQEELEQNTQSNKVVLQRLNEDFVEKDINKPKIWNWEKFPQYDQYKDEVDRYMRQKEEINKNKWAQLFVDEDEDITKKVKSFLQYKQQQHGVGIHDEYEDLLFDSIKYDYFKK